MYFSQVCIIGISEIVGTTQVCLVEKIFLLLTFFFNII